MGDSLMDDELKEMIWCTRKGSQIEKIRIKRANDLITKKDGDRVKKDKDLLNVFFQILLTHNTKSSNMQTSHQPNTLQN